MAGARERVDPLDDKGAVDVIIDNRPHLLQEEGHVYHLRLDRRVADKGPPAGQGRGHQQVFGRRHAGIGQGDIGAVEMVGFDIVDVV